MKKNIALALAVLLLLSLLAGCGNKNVQVSASGGTYGDQPMREAAVPESYAAGIADYDTAAAMNTSKLAAGDNGAESIPLPENRKWIITMHLEAETEDMDGTLLAVSSQISAAGGYVESQNVTNTSAYRSKRSASLTVRIPADRVDAFAEAVNGMANVTSSNRSVRDITLTYADTEGRVTALRTEETRLLELMEKAESMSDLLEIEARLTEVRYQLESYASQLRTYDNQVDYATVDLYISEVKKYTPMEEPGFFKRIADGLSESIVNLGQTIVDTIVWVIVNLPYLIVLGLIGWGVTTLFRRRRARRKAKKQNAGNPQSNP